MASSASSVINTQAKPPRVSEGVGLWDEPLVKSGGIEEFLQNYILPTEQDEWNKLKSRAMDILKQRLDKERPKVNLTGRVKDEDSLRKRLYERYKTSPTPNQILHDTDPWDFMGLRIAMYFPGQQEKVVEIIKIAFEEDPLQRRSADTRISDKTGGQKSRFGGYEEDHYWVRLLEKDRTGAGTHAAQLFEIQLRSVFMDTWDTMSHDLDYKAVDGVLSMEEERILDSIKGLAKTGELLLEHLDEVHQSRIKADERTILNAHELRGLLVDILPQIKLTPDNSSGWFRESNSLFRLLRATGITTVGTLRGTLKKLNVSKMLGDGYQKWVTEREHLLPPSQEGFILYTILQRIPDEALGAIWKRTLPNLREFYMFNEYSMYHVVRETLGPLAERLLQGYESILDTKRNTTKLSILWYSSLLLYLYPRRPENLALMSNLLKVRRSHNLSTYISPFEFAFQQYFFSSEPSTHDQHEEDESYFPGQRLLDELAEKNPALWNQGFEQFKEAIMKVASQESHQQNAVPMELINMVRWQSLESAAYAGMPSLLQLEIGPNEVVPLRNTNGVGGMGDWRHILSKSIQIQVDKHESKRVSRKGVVTALWKYLHPSEDEPAIEELYKMFGHGVWGPGQTDYY